MRSDVHGSKFIDEVLTIVAFIGTEGEAARPVRTGLDHRQCSDPLGMTVSLCERRIDDKAHWARYRTPRYLSAMRFSIKAWPM